ncbi:Ribose 5-phosphate isomerase A [Paenibacillus pasadenensis]|uniref:Ribose-5-phosphate isomerase A n=1 Tax=Paenibacillus pasadenensis TaxID=217090 RepID=A0A2N5NDA6_9BACL|nr:ribose 5-phosphate isomerase A [Paenibacillus pasadenensis]PLT48298.1 Ribose 5-phosphate isomerase A [Paenibacillus pasadenensis]
MNFKQAAGIQAAEAVASGMKVGLGTGSTVYYTILELGRRMKEEGLRFTGVPTSDATEKLALELGIPLAELSELEPLDVTIDGADEVTPELALIKGGGAAHFREKMVAAVSKRLVIVADESKAVGKLGAFTVPVEIAAYGWRSTARRVEAAGCRAVRRERDGQPVVTDNGNYVLDCDFGLIEEPGALDRELKGLLGVLETGLFVGMADAAYIAGPEGVRVLRREAWERG